MEIIAEIGQNHNGDLSLGLELIRQAKACGAEVAKFQIYDAKRLFPKEGNPWYEYNCKTEVSREQLKVYFDECNRVGIEFMASAFDPERVQWLEELGVKRYKIASRSVQDGELLAAVAKTGKPMIVSLGMWSGKEFPLITSTGGVSYLYCISQYPTPLNQVHLNEVDFKKYQGFSDHTVGISASEAALARGAAIIEKHFTLDPKFYGPDHECSMTPTELKTLVQFRNDLREIL